MHQILYRWHYHKYTLYSEKMIPHMHRVLYGWHYHKYTVKKETVHASDFVWLALSQAHSEEGDCTGIDLPCTSRLITIQYVLDANAL